MSCVQRPKGEGPPTVELSSGPARGRWAPAHLPGMAELVAKHNCILFDWGDTLMRGFPGSVGPMADWPHVEAIPQAARVLAQLSQTYILGVATNATDSDEQQIRAALARVGLDSFVDKIYGWQTVGYRKPSPEFFAHVLDDLGMEPEQVVVVGDDFETDILGACRLGLKAIWFNERNSEKRAGEGYTTVHDLGQVGDALSALGFPTGV